MVSRDAFLNSREPHERERDFSSMPRASGPAYVSHLDVRPGMASMPPPRAARGQGEGYTCPKCNKEFRDSESADLLAHMDACTA